jgi:hypothetical protein
MSWGEIYNTSWWGVALDTARTVKARPDFFGSQLNLLTSEQPNLVVNGSFDTDSDWTKPSGWSIEDGVANSNAGAYRTLAQNMPIILGKKYEVVYDVVSYISGSVSMTLGADSGILRNAVGTYSEVIEYVNFYPSAGPRTGPSGFIGSIDNISVQLVRAELDQIEAKKCLADWIHTTALKDLNN